MIHEPTGNFEPPWVLDRDPRPQPARVGDGLPEGEADRLIHAGCEVSWGCDPRSFECGPGAPWARPGHTPDGYVPPDKPAPARPDVYTEMVDRLRTAPLVERPAVGGGFSPARVEANREALEELTGDPGPPGGAVGRGLLAAAGSVFGFYMVWQMSRVMVDGLIVLTEGAVATVLKIIEVL